MLQDKIELIKPYFKSLETYNEALIVRVQFPPKWAVFPSDDGKIKAANSESKAYEYFYYGDGSEVSLDAIFDFIKETVEVNQSLEEKAKLLVQRANELQELFEITPLEKLKTLKFVMEEPKKVKAKRKYTKTKKDAEKAKEVALSESTDKVDSGDVEEEVKTAETSISTSSASTENTSEIKVSTSTLNKFKKAKRKHS